MTRSCVGICSNSRPREAGDGAAPFWRWQVGVPIHARAKRATSVRRPLPAFNSMFQFTPARSGRRRSKPWLLAARGRSNSRPREAGDGSVEQAVLDLSGFQFTPARSGRLDTFSAGMLIQDGSNSRPREAGDIPISMNGTRRLKFQFTPARSGRRAVGRQWGRHKQFQFTPARSGRRNGVAVRALAGGVPIHARAKRATGVVMLGLLAMFCSNSRPREAGDDKAWDLFTKLIMFQFTPVRSGRRA